MGFRRDAELAECQAELREARQELQEARRQLRSVQVPVREPLVREPLISPALARCRTQVEQVQQEIALIRAEIARLTGVREPLVEREILRRPAELVFRPTRVEVARAIDRTTTVILDEVERAQRAEIERAVRTATDVARVEPAATRSTVVANILRDTLSDLGINVRRVTVDRAIRAATTSILAAGDARRTSERIADEILTATRVERQAAVETAVRDAFADLLELDVRPSVVTFERTLQDRLLDQNIRVSQATLAAAARAGALTALDVFGVREAEVPRVVVEPRRVRTCPEFWQHS